jgi:hypothetical protein
VTNQRAGKRSRGVEPGFIAPFVYPNLCEAGFILKVGLLGLWAHGDRLDVRWRELFA